MLTFIPFWKLTYFGWSSLYNKLHGYEAWSKFLERSFDEYHNATATLLVPFVGAFTITRGDNFTTTHVYGLVGGELLGYFDPDCDACIAIVTMLADA